MPAHALPTFPVPSCATCKYVLTTQSTGGRAEYECSKVSGSAYVERRSGVCGPNGVNWEAA